MEAKELMLGDLIYPDNIDASIVARVVHIGEREIGFLAPNSGVIWWNQPENVRPIPITPEILEKNGFVKTDDGWECDENRVVTIALHSEKSCDMWIAETSYEWKHLRYMLPSPKCVHELQHALRLVGIEKEIVL